MHLAKALRIAGAILVGIYVVWLIASTWFVYDGVHRVNAAQPYVTIVLGRAISWWPGHLSGRDLRLTIHDSGVEIDMAFEHFSLDIDVPSLTQKHFVTTMTKLDGVTFYYRTTRRLPELCATPGLPPITGQASSEAVHCMEQSETALSPRPSAPPEKRWQVRLDGIELQAVKDVWIDQIRMQGDGIVNGSFYLWPGERISVTADTAHWDTLTTSMAGQPLLSNAALDITMAIAETSLRESANVWNATTGTASVHHGTVSLARFKPFVGMASVDVEVAVENGDPRSIIASARARDFGMHVGEKQLTGVLDASVRLTPTAAKARVLRFSDSRARLANIAIDGTSYPDHAFAISTLPNSVVIADKSRVDIELVATCNSNAPALALLPSTFAASIAGLVIGANAPLTAAVKVHGTYARLMADPLTVNGGALELSGSLALAPKLSGKLNAHVGPLSKTFEVD